MATLEHLIECFIAELKRVQSSGVLQEERKDGVKGPPGLLSIGNGDSILTSREMERLMQAVAHDLKREDPALARTHTDREWNWMVRTAFGPALVPIDLDGDLDQNAKLVLVALRKSLAQRGLGAIEHALGCTLFGDFNLDPFAIGPVTFEPRLEWLSRKAKEGGVSKTTVRRVTKNWQGDPQRKRKQSWDFMREKAVLSAVGKCPYVCSVQTLDLGDEAGRLKAQTAARLAMTAVALRWTTPSRALDGFNLLVDGGVRLQQSIFFVPGKGPFLSGTMQGMPHGPRMTSANWRSELNAHQGEFDVAGEAISYFLSSTGSVARPKLMNTLIQALLWFHEGCREQVPLMAVVKFSASMDALALGGKTGGIRRFIVARLGIPEDRQIRKDGPTMRAAVDEIYSQGRSRTIHGTNEKIGHDWSSTRELSEAFARLCLIAALDWAARNPSLDDPLRLQG